MKIKVSLSPRSIERAIKELEDYKKWLTEKSSELCRRLAEVGVEVATAEFSAVDYDGDKDFDVVWEEDGSGCRVVAKGQSVLFLEFGSGAKMGGGHPLNQEFGMGPGTWSEGPQGKGHWDDPNGWYVPGHHGLKSEGNKPAMGMYLAGKQMREQIETIAREVFQH